MYSPEMKIDQFVSRKAPAPFVPASPLDLLNLDQIEMHNNKTQAPLQAFVSRYYEPNFYETAAKPPPSGTSGKVHRSGHRSQRASIVEHGFDQDAIKIKTNGVFVQKHLLNVEHIDQFKRMCQQESCTIIDTYEIHVSIRYETISVQQDRKSYNVLKAILTYKNTSHMTMNHLVVIVNTQKGTICTIFQ